MTIRHVGLINKSSANISFAEIAQVSQALQTQLDRDFTPAWGIQAQIIPFQSHETLPSRVWPIRIVDKPKGGLGIHLDSGHKPYAQVQATADWSVTASHELLEMLVDPYGHKFAQGPDINPASDGHLVSYLIEVGDPCEIYEYNIGSVAVSDFVLPDYYNANAPTGAAIDFLAQLSKPYEVPGGCYISWIDVQDARWHQKTPAGNFVRAKSKVDPKQNPRDNRDVAFGEEEAGRRHDLPGIRTAYCRAGASKRS